MNACTPVSTCVEKRNKFFYGSQIFLQSATEICSTKKKIKNSYSFEQRTNTFSYETFLATLLHPLGEVKNRFSFLNAPCYPEVE